MAIKIYNPRRVLREGSKAMLQDAADKNNVVLFRAGNIEVKGQKVIVGSHGHALNTFGADVANKVFRLVECTPEEVLAYQKQLNNEEGQEGPQA